MEGPCTDTFLALLQASKQAEQSLQNEPHTVKQRECMVAEGIPIFTTRLSKSMKNHYIRLAKQDIGMVCIVIGMPTFMDFIHPKTKDADLWAALENQDHLFTLDQQTTDYMAKCLPYVKQHLARLRSFQPLPENNKRDLQSGIFLEVVIEASQYDGDVPTTVRQTILMDTSLRNAHYGKAEPDEADLRSMCAAMGIPTTQEQLTHVTSMFKNMTTEQKQSFYSYMDQKLQDNEAMQSLLTMEVNKASSKCWHCQKLYIGAKRCGKCKKALYCTRDCQRAHWNIHKEECKSVV